MLIFRASGKKKPKTKVVLVLLCQIELPVYQDALKYILPQKFMMCFLPNGGIAYLFVVYFLLIQQKIKNL